MNFCQWVNLDIQFGDGDDGSYMHEFDEKYCCGEPAMWKRWGAWFCPKHYDWMGERYGEPNADEDL